MIEKEFSGTEGNSKTLKFFDKIPILGGMGFVKFWGFQTFHGKLFCWGLGRALLKKLGYSEDCCKMKRISSKEVLRKINERQPAGNNTDQRVLDAVRASAALFLLTLDRESFLSLIWQDRDGSRLLTPPGESRTLQDVTQRMVEMKLRFRDLALNLNKPREEHDPEWFERCLELDNTFDFERFGLVIVVLPTDSERKQSPGGTFYIYDGVHKTLVLSRRLLSNETEFRPVEALLVLPRPEN